MFFDDPALSRKKVSMRGANASKTESKQNFLEKTQQERERRHLEKLRLRSATKLQAIWRGRKIRNINQTIQREEFDKLVHDWETLLILPTVSQSKLNKVDSMSIDSSPKENGKKVLDSESLRLLLRKFLFFYREHLDQERLDKVALFLLDNLRIYSKQSDSKLNFVYLETPHIVAVYGLQIKKYLALALKRLSQRIDIYLQIVLYFTTPDLVLLANSIPSTSKVALSSRISTYIVEKGMYKYIQQLIIAFAPLPVSSNTNVELVKLLMSISLRPLQNASTQVLVQFVENILSIPYLTKRVDNSIIAIFVGILPIVLSFEPSNLNAETARFLLGNLCALGNLFLKSFNITNTNSIDSKVQDQLTVYIKFISLLLRNTVESIFQAENDPQLIEQLGTLVDASVLKNMFSIFLPSGLKNPVNSISQLSRGLVHVCNMYILLQSYWKSHQNTIINSLTYNTPIVKNIWSLVSKSVELQELERTGSITDSLLDLSSILLIFSKCYTYILMVMDDSEFFETQTYIKLSEHSQMVFSLKNILFKMYWNSIKSRDLLLRESLTQLLQQLYDRNARHIFCPEENWVENTVQESDYESERMQNILMNIPFTIPFKKRLKIFYDIVEREKSMNQLNPMDAVRIRVRRNYVFEDAYSSLNQLDEKLKGIVRVEYISSSGLPEPGIDGGGMFKEFFGELIKTAYKSEYGLFRETPNHEIYPNPHSQLLVSEDLKKFEFLGKILAKAIMENILVELPFANFFLAKLLGKFNYVNDLVFLDETLHKNLMFLKKTEDVEDLCLTFTLVESELGHAQVKELLPGGKDLSVTNDNKLKYIALMANYLLNIQIKEQSAAFLRGFSKIIAPDLIRMFNQDELQTIISGNTGGIDIENLQKNTVYSGGYSESHYVIKAFWRVLASLTPEEQRKFLMFVTSCSRPPHLGFERLKPAFAIHRALPQGDPNHYLPTASTCMNFLKLPPYSDERIMKEKILYAINAKAGFELS